MPDKRHFVAVALLALAVITVSLSAAAPAALAQQPAEIDPAADRSASFQAVEGPTQEDIAGLPLMVAAYAVVWLLVLAYVARLGVMHRRLDAEITRISRGLGEMPAPAPARSKAPAKASGVDVSAAKASAGETSPAGEQSGAPSAP